MGMDINQPSLKQLCLSCQQRRHRGMYWGGGVMPTTPLVSNGVSKVGADLVTLDII